MSTDKQDESRNQEKGECVDSAVIQQSSCSNNNSFEIESLLSAKEEAKNTSYYALLKSNRNFRYYLASYIANHTGEWLTYLASISTIEAIQAAHGQTSTSAKAISRLVVIRLLPNVILSPFGGVLADGRDRRHVMIALDVAGAVVAWLFILAWQLQSIPMVYIATFLQECFSGLYEPSRSAIIPLLVSKEDDLQMATTISGLSWSVVAAFASSGGGFLVGMFGMRACYMIDSLTYLISALLMYNMGGKWNVAADEDYESIGAQIKGMFFDGVSYLYQSFFGALVLIKASGCLIFGGFDVLNVSFSEQGSVEARPFRLGMLFASVGVGCLLAPSMFDWYADMSKPKTLQNICLISLSVLVTCGTVLIGFANNFWLICALTVMRAVGSSGLWIYSSLLLQKFSRPDMLGRVTSLEYALALLSEAFSAYFVGVLQDDFGLSIREVCLGVGCLASVVLSFWFLYDWRGGGAARFSETGDSDKMTGDSETATYSGVSTKGEL